MSCQAALTAPKPVASGLPILLVAAAALIDRDGRILLAEHAKKDAFHGMWEFPGGKVEPGESPELALMRELEEELGIETRPTCYYPIGFASHPYPEYGRHMLMPLYTCRIWRGEVIAREGQKLQWAKLSDLPHINFVPGDIPLIPQLIDRL